MMAKLSAELRDSIWQALDELARHHRGFEDAPWVLTKADLDIIEETAKAFRPEDPIAKYRYLFDEHTPDIGQRRIDRAAEYIDAVREERATAAREVLEAQGLAGIQRLAAAAKQPFAVGWSLGDSGERLDEDAVLADVDNDDNQRANFADGFVWQRVESEGLPWIDAVMPTLAGRPLAEARVLRAWRDLNRAWRRAEELGPDVEGAYWKEFVPMGLGTEFALVNETARHILRHHRPGTATDLLSLYADNVKHPVDADLVTDVLETLVEAPADEQRRVSPYELQRLLELLRASNVNQDRVEILEWRLLPALGYGVPAPSLERRLARDPAFFVDLLSMCFKRADGARDRDVSTDVVHNAYRLLQEWKIVPGSTEGNGEVDETRLKVWIEQTRDLLAKADRIEIGEIYVGHVLAHAKEDADGTWPTLPVRNIIDALASPTIEQGFGTEIHNKRGVTARGLSEGGKQEYELADRFYRWAALIADQWPRTAAVLRAAVADYRVRGRVEDEEAERFKKGLDLFG
jgi:hypothetical protein